MKLKTLAAMALAGTLAAGPALAELVIPDLSYRTGPYAAGGIPFADGYADYMTLLNARDGGIGGVMTRILECETGITPKKVLNATRPPRAKAHCLSTTFHGHHISADPKGNR